MNLLEIREDQMFLPSGDVITFNDEQFLGIKRINKWLSEDDNLFFVLAGYAGTGKTTMLKKILDGYDDRVVVTAPTHKAKNIISQLTNMPAQTLHSLLGLRPDLDLDDFNPNKPIFNPIAPPKIHKYDFLIVDEASMINYNLFSLITDLAKSTKVLFVGDPAQIPPVGEKASYVFINDDIPKHQLTKIERQNLENPLCSVYTSLRNNLYDPNSGISRITKLDENKQGIEFTTNKKHFRRKLLKMFLSDEFKKNRNYCKVIAWRNITIRLSNKIIRQYLFNKSNDIVLKGDLLMGYRHITSGINKPLIEISSEYEVVLRSDIRKNRYGIYGYDVKIKENITGKYFYVFIVDSNVRENLDLYQTKHDKLIKDALKNRKLWSRYYEFRRNNLLLINIDRYPDGSQRPERDIIKKDLDYGYGITAHKSQGSTYEHVFVMEDDINLNPLIKERNQIKYVALTRPSKSATVLTNQIF